VEPLTSLYSTVFCAERQTLLRLQLANWFSLLPTKERDVEDDAKGFLSYAHVTCAVFVEGPLRERRIQHKRQTDELSRSIFFVRLHSDRSSHPNLDTAATITAALCSSLLDRFDSAERENETAKKKENSKNGSLHICVQDTTKQLIPERNEGRTSEAEGYTCRGR